MTTIRILPGRTVMSLEDVHNAINVAVRHCRIGKVRPKPSKIGIPDGWKWPGHDEPLMNDDPWWKRQWSPSFMDKCGCRVGSTCGNAACPHGMTVTC